jgi:hypothetical protein
MRIIPAGAASAASQPIVAVQNREGASIWLRTRDGQTWSRFVRPWPGGKLDRRRILAQPGDFARSWHAYLVGVADADARWPA